MRRIIATVALAALVACSGGGSPAPKALLSFVDHVQSGQWGPLWDQLLTEQQQQIPRDAFIDCMARQGGGQDTGAEVKVVASYAEKVTPPGTRDSFDTTAVTLEFSKAGDSYRQTFHVFPGDRFSMDPATFDRCKP